MYILGLSSYAHESSCSLIKDGEVRTIIEEERLNREKHTWKIPEQAIKYCLKMEGITISDIDIITFFWKPKKEIIENIFHIIRFFPKSLNILSAKSGGSEISAFSRIALMNNIDNTLQARFNLQKKPNVIFIGHHDAHAASTFFTSNFKEAATLVVDGRGESVSTTMYIGKDNKLTKIQEIKIPHSLGHFYAAVTDYLGFRPFFDEWKVMGMSAYGKGVYLEKFDNIISLLPDGDFRLNLKYFDFHTHGSAKWISDYFIENFGPKRKPNDSFEQRHFDIAYALQKCIEKAGVHLAQHIHSRTKVSNLCLTGGVALNVLMNREIIKKTPFQNVFIQPVANDAGTSFGSALFYYHQMLGNERKFKFEHVYWGPEFTNEEIELVLKKYNMNYKKSKDIAKETAAHIADNKIVGWFQGRMEAGPRALGNRSITVSPLDKKMKDRLNQRVKKREFFRPFAPSILEEYVNEFFEMPKDMKSPFMILAGDVKKEKRDVIPAVTHVDNTARVHTVNRYVNPRYWNLINEFAKITTVPVILNTSFNENEPIVCSPQQAIDCFLRTEFDILAIGDFLVLQETSYTNSLS